MIQGLYAAASGLEAVEERQSVIANNIANGSTVGFRRQEPIQKGYYTLFEDELTDTARFDEEKAPGGTKIDQTFTDTKGGSISTTQDPMNVALSGPGFFAITTPQGTRFTRNGKLALDTESQLTSADGSKLEDVGDNPITVRGSNVTVNGQGEITASGQRVGQLKVVEFPDPHALTRVGEGLYAAPDSAVQQMTPATKTTVVHKALEMSNVNLPQEMVNMILGMRAYGANQKVINTIDDTSDKLIQQVAMPT